MEMYQQYQTVKNVFFHTKSLKNIIIMRNMYFDKLKMMIRNRTREVVVETKHGAVRGCCSSSIYDDTFYSFEGIPYAVPPLGNLRFREPVPIAPWSHILNCTTTPQKPMQKNLLSRQVEGSEDCLYLNIFTKELKTAAPLPVMVFLMGGAFVGGNPTTDLHGPDYFMMKEVVLVTISYRVGPLGFLSLEDPALEVPGNAGLKDQLLALHWIKRNIESFNGDKDNITLFGLSAGAASVHYLMLTPLAKDLFQRAILMSGNFFCPWALSPLKNMPHRLAAATGYGDGQLSDHEVLEYLQVIQAEELFGPYIVTKEENLDDCLFGFGPVIEPYKTPSCIIPAHPTELLATAWGNNIPVIMGGTSFEGLLMNGRVQAAPFLLTELKDNCEHMLPLELKQKYPLEKQKELGKIIRELHFGDREVNMDNILRYCDYASYKIFWLPILRTLRMRLRYSRMQTFLYRFDFDSTHFNHQRTRYCGEGSTGVAHADDRSYIFYGTYAWKLAKNTMEFKTIQRMIDIWTSFATFANPNCKEIEGFHWQPQSPTGKIQCLNIAEELEIIELPEMKKLEVWECLFKDP